MRTAPNEDGFTLIELLVAISILLVIIAPVGTALTLSLRTLSEANDRLGLAHDVSISNSAFASDIASAESVWITDPAPTCGPAGGVLYLGWTDDALIHRVTYHVVTVDDETRLVRHRCVTGQTATQQVLSHFVGTVATPLCDGASCAGAVSSAEKPREVILKLTDTEGTTRALRGTRRTH